MIQAKLVSPEKLVLEYKEIPLPAIDEVIIKVKYAGLCGSDVHAYLGELPAVRFPVVPGHEFSGIVVATGKEVKRCKKGDRVVAEPFIPCGKCYNCKHALYYLCEELKIMGFQVDGAFRQYVTVHQERIHFIPQKLDLKVAAFTEPLAVAVHAVKEAKISPQDHILIMGAGTIGLLALQIAKSLGAEVIITDLFDFKLNIAKNLGGDKTVNVSKTSIEDLFAHDFNEENVDVVLDCVGIPSDITKLINMVRKGIKIISIGGITGEKVEVPIGQITKKELKIMGSFLYTSQDFEQAMQYLNKGLIDVVPLISHISPLDKIKEAYSLFIGDKRHTSKMLIDIGG